MAALKVPLERVPVLLFGLVCLLALIGFLLYPTYPNYDSYYSMLWARELTGPDPMLFEGFRVPTEHPLAIFASVLLLPFGEGADRLWVGLVIASFLVLMAGLYRLGRLAFTPLVGGIGAFLLLSRFDFPFLAARGYIDIPYMALVVWAGVLEMQRRRRGDAVLILLALAGMLRPEAWVLTGFYWLYLMPGASNRDRLKWTALAAIGPLVWVTTDFIVTGDAKFSLTYTSSSAEDLDRQSTLGELPAAVPDFLIKIIKLPVFIAACVGLAASMLLFPKRLGMPALLLAASIVTFFAIGVAGLSVIDRYLAIGGLVLLVFAGVGLGGWTMLEPGRPRTAWMAAAGAAVIFGIVYTAINVNVTRLQSELAFRGDSHKALAELLDSPGVKRTLRCGPVTVPNHKLVPDVRWIADLPADRVWPRADPSRRPQTRGIQIIVTSRFALFRQAFTDQRDPPQIELVTPGFRRVAVSDDYAAYARC